MIRYVIIEDEQDQVEVLNLYIQRYHNTLQFAGVAKSVQAGIKLIGQQNPDIVFLDIHLEDGMGFEIIEQLNQFNGALLVFTAFEEQALNAFRHNAIDFLEKPINRAELATAVNKAIRWIGEQQTQEKYILSLAEGRMVLAVEEIILLSAQGSATQFYVYRNGKEALICSGYSLGKHEEKLPSPPFYRIHDKYLLNTNYLQKINPDNSLLLKHGIDLEKKLGRPLNVAQNRIREFKTWLIR